MRLKLISLFAKERTVRGAAYLYACGVTFFISSWRPEKMERLLRRMRVQDKLWWHKCDNAQLSYAQMKEMVRTHTSIENAFFETTKLDIIAAYGS